jgi:hypothetical protein
MRRIEPIISRSLAKSHNMTSYELLTVERRTENGMKSQVTGRDDERPGRRCLFATLDRASI